MVHMPRRISVLVGVWLVALLVGPAARADRKPHGGMMRYPDVSATQIVFVYADDLWVVPRTGGIARPLASPPGGEMFPRFSADGQTIAFMGNYHGNTDLYTISVDGGVPTRVTHHPSREFLCDWTPDGRLLFDSSGYRGMGRTAELMTAPATGGLPEKLPVPYGAMGAISDDGTWLAYTPRLHDFSTWKRYRGGMATDIWLFNLHDHSAKKITDWEGDDSLPMWHGQTIYYLSDEGPKHRKNIWSCDTKSGRRRQITTYEKYDVKWPAIGPGPSGSGEIVFQNGSDLVLLDLASGRPHVVDVTVPGDRPQLLPQRVDVSRTIDSGGISATGQRGVCSARGDIWTIPAEKGMPRNLTRTSGVAERDPAWSPDGRWIAYFSDATGEYELYITQSDGKGETRQCTKNNTAFLTSPTWSPDSKHIAFTDDSASLFVYTLEGDSIARVETDPWGRTPTFSWSHDANWIAYTRMNDNQQTSIWLYKRATGEQFQVTSGMFYDTWPAFDRKGDWLFFASNRHFANPKYEDIGSTWIYDDTDTLVAVPLRKDIKTPWLPKSDEESWEKKKKETPKEPAGPEKPATKPAETEPAVEAGADVATTKPADGNAGTSEEVVADKKAETKPAKPEEKPLEIDIDGFEARALHLPVSSGAFVNLAVNSDGKLLYVRRNTGQSPAIKLFDLNDEDKKEQTVLDGAFGFDMSGDGKKLLVRQGPRFAIINAQPGQKFDKPLSTDGLVAVIDPREEWRQVFVDAWRIERQYFYVDNMNGVDWPAVRAQYEPMLEDCVSRSDVRFVISEMIAELNIGHAYYQGDNNSGPRVGVGMLGCDFDLHDGAFRIKYILRGGPWDLDARGPLNQPGVCVREGDYLLAVNGLPLDTSKDPWAAFQGLNGDVVCLTVSDKPVLEVKSPDEAEDEPAEEAEEAKDAASKPSDEKKETEKEKKDPYAGQREVLVKLLGSEGDLRYRDWVEHNRAYVAEKTGGKVGYIYVPDTSINGQDELVRQFFGQRDRQALIIDERWNGGGQASDRFIELLNRPVLNYWATRHGKDEWHPSDSHQGPKCMLINGEAGSGGDAFPYFFRQAGLGKLIGMRTWGGLVGISGNPGLIDGDSVTVPRSGFYELDGTWGIEGHGVDPDIEVIDDPSKMVDGSDPQLDAAISYMLSEIERNPYVPPHRPQNPDRSGMGVREVDK